jgi:hypothetical protein
LLRIDGESSITGWNHHVSPGLSIKGTSHCAGWIAHPWQAYNGGPNTGVFLQITCDDPADLQVPDQKCTFGVVKAGKRAAISRCWPNATGGSCASISVRAAGLTSLNDAVRQALA